MPSEHENRYRDFPLKRDAKQHKKNPVPQSIEAASG
jgi:hypothetical protein